MAQETLERQAAQLKEASLASSDGAAAREEAARAAAEVARLQVGACVGWCREAQGGQEGARYVCPHWTGCVP
jgi:hypothetical protein